jgi:hypothetical protein
VKETEDQKVEEEPKESEEDTKMEVSEDEEDSPKEEDKPEEKKEEVKEEDLPAPVIFEDNQSKPTPAAPPPRKVPIQHGNPLDTIKIRRPSQPQVPPAPGVPKPLGTVSFWRGGLNFEGSYICNMVAYCKAELQNVFNR